MDWQILVGKLTFVCILMYILGLDLVVVTAQLLKSWSRSCPFRAAPQLWVEHLWKVLFKKKNSLLFTLVNVNKHTRSTFLTFKNNGSQSILPNQTHCILIPVRLLIESMYKILFLKNPAALLAALFKFSVLKKSY